MKVLRFMKKIPIIDYLLSVLKKNDKKEDSSKDILQTIIDLLPIRIFWKDINLNYLGCNKIFAQDAGKNSIYEVIGKDDFQMGWKDQAELYRNDDMQVINSGKSKINYIEEQTTPEGKTIWLNTNKVPLRINDNEIMGILGTYSDVTDRKLADELSKKQTEELAQINSIMVGRELRMAELKKKAEEMKPKG